MRRAWISTAVQQEGLSSAARDRPIATRNLS